MRDDPYATIAEELRAAPVAGEPDPDDGRAEGDPGGDPRDDRAGDQAPPRDGGSGRPHGMIWDGCPVIPLGVHSDLSWYLDITGQLRGVDNHTIQKMLHLFGGDRARHHVARHFPVFDKEGNSRPGRFDQLTLSSAMIAACAERGVWSPTGRVRGAGAWADDDGALIYHAGDQVLIGGTWHPPGTYGGKVYPASDPIPRPASEARGDPAAEVLDLIGTWEWRRPDIDPVIVLGLTCAQMMGGALDWRPVGWWTGDAATGKTTLQRGLLHLHGGEAGLLQAADATEAGIRSVVGQSSLPVAVDELEPDADNPRKVKAVIELARRAASGGVVFRGSTDQRGHQGTARSAFVFSSILVPPMPSQDRSRLILLELDRIPEGRPQIRLDPRGLRRIGAQLRRRLIDGWPGWAGRLELWRAALARHGQTGRGADNYATVLAMADMAMRAELPDQEILEAWASKLGRAVTEEAVDVGSNADDMLTWLLGQEYDVWRSGERYIVAQWLMAAGGLPAAPPGILGLSAPTDAKLRRDDANAKLAKVGLRVEGAGEAAQLVIASSPLPGLMRLFEGSPWAGGVWSQAARRVPGAEARPPVSFAGQKSRATAIPFASIPGLSAFPMDRPVTAPRTPSVACDPAEMDDFY